MAGTSVRMKLNLLSDKKKKACEIKNISYVNMVPVFGVLLSDMTLRMQKKKFGAHHMYFKFWNNFQPGLSKQCLILPFKSNFYKI